MSGSGLCQRASSPLRDLCRSCRYAYVGTGTCGNVMLSPSKFKDWKLKLKGQNLPIKSDSPHNPQKFRQKTHWRKNALFYFFFDGVSFTQYPKLTAVKKTRRRPLIRNSKKRHGLKNTGSPMRQVQELSDVILSILVVPKRLVFWSHYDDLEPNWPVFLKVNPPKQGRTSNQNKGPHLGSRMWNFFWILGVGSLVG